MATYFVFFTHLLKYESQFYNRTQVATKFDCCAYAIRLLWHFRTQKVMPIHKLILNLMQ